MSTLSFYPCNAEVAAIMDRTGMDRLQAVRHAQQRAMLVAKMDAELSRKAAECAQRWAANARGQA